jgi:DNA invertase Pin-like site-specific DNA recombinase
MASGNFIAYFRVSTDKQGKSGLGLEAQQKAVTDYLNGGKWRLVSSFVEIESGKKNDRPKLQEALVACRLHRATLVIAKLDRLSRNAHFLLGLQEAGVQFVCCDMPQANALTIGIMAVVAQEERKMISQRTKDALAAAKARGVSLGGDRGHLHRYQRKASAVGAVSRIASANDRAKDLAAIITPLMSEGQSLRAIASCLDAQGIKTARGSSWTAAAVSRVIKRLAA